MKITSFHNRTDGLTNSYAVFLCLFLCSLSITTLVCYCVTPVIFLCPIFFSFPLSCHPIFFCKQSQTNYSADSSFDISQSHQQQIQRQSANLFASPLKSPLKRSTSVNNRDNNRSNIHNQDNNSTTVLSDCLKDNNNKDESNVPHNATAGGFQISSSNNPNSNNINNDNDKNSNSTPSASPSSFTTLLNDLDNLSASDLSGDDEELLGNITRLP